jgi:hypothetical protein
MHKSRRLGEELGVCKGKTSSHNNSWETVIRTFNRRTFADQQRQLQDNLNCSFTSTLPSMRHVNLRIST